MPDKSAEGGQPSLEKLTAEGVSPRRCISYEELGEYNGGGSKAAKPASNGDSKPKGVLASVGRKGSGY